MCRKRNEVERLFRRLKEFRRIFSRFDKLDVIFMVFVHFALIFERCVSVNGPWSNFMKTIAASKQSQRRPLRESFSEKAVPEEISANGEYEAGGFAQS